MVNHLVTAISQADVARLADEFLDSWSVDATVSEAFADLCEAAQQPHVTTRTLRKLADVIASRVGPAALGPNSVLNSAAEALIRSEEDFERRRQGSVPRPFDESARVDMAEKILLAQLRGHVVVWLVYSRAITEFRLVAGPITFLSADWALQVAFDDEPNDFAERAELRAMRGKVFWLESAEDATQDAKNRLALVRVDLGERSIAGAIDDARGSVEALLSIAVEAGGVSWRDAGASAALVDGEVRVSSPFLVLDRRVTGDDTYGMAATSELMKNAVDQLDDALSQRPMPPQLIEALAALRQARMTDHRDVSFYDAEALSPRVATALEDHAVEQLASTLDVDPEELAKSLQCHETLMLADRLLAQGLTAPFERSWASDDHTAHERLEREVVEYANGGGTISIRRVVERADAIQALQMSALQRADFEHALDMCTNPATERAALARLWQETTVLRARHRRVRNAVNHGLPLSASMLHSVRRYAERTSTEALHLALTWFKSGRTGTTLLAAEIQAWSDRQTRLNEGVSWLAYENGIADADE